ncbi:MAG: histidine phosphatase family protein [Lachnospiraceae bacterium]|nr:histidine phosphatase family protein [Lachnospiraceae bacterium]
MRLTFIRHGETKGNLEGRYVGRTDEPLCDKGRENLLARKARGEYPPEPQMVFVSPLQRCRQSAEIIYPNAEPFPVSEFVECDFGDFEMKNYDELSGDPAYQEWIDSGGTAPFPNGESMDQVKTRVLRGFYRALEQMGGKDACFVVHGGTIMAILSIIVGGEFYERRLANGECVTVHVSVPNRKCL